MTSTGPVLEVSNLAVEYPKSGFRQQPHRVIQDVSFSLGVGETLALVGESGSGKSTIGKAILGLAPVAAGRVTLKDQDITRLSARARRPLASELQAVFQNPYGSLNPSLTVGQILAEPLRAARIGAREAHDRIATLLQRVRMPIDTMTRYPGEFSGGQRQRIAIARAIALDPGVVICDEPTSALDVSTQAAVLELLAELQSRLHVSYLFITHDLAVVRQFADRTLVLQAGRIVEEGTSAEVCERPVHPYTQRLVAAAPVPDPVLQRERRRARLETPVRVA